MQDEHGMARMQELLASYYGTQDKETQAQSRRDIDAPGFEPATYVKEMLATQGLNELMRQDDRLIREIKELDTNMQMLVYENYNKFISATDTIRKMKNNVASMEDEVERVVASMDVITAKSESINVALAPHRSKVEKLIGVRRLLKRLEFIFDLPQRLNSAFKKEEYANAAKYFLLARRILGRYEHITSFKAIQVEADKIIHQLEQTLAKRLVDPALASEEICESITLLHQLDSCTDEMRQQFLDWHQDYFARALAPFQATREDESVAQFLARVNTDVLVKMTRVYSTYKQLFLSGGGDARESRSPLAPANRDDAFLGFVKDSFGLYLAACERQFRRPHREFGTAEEVLALEDADGDSDNDSARYNSQYDDDDYSALMRVLKRFLASAKAANGIVPIGRLESQAVDVVEACVRVQIDAVFQRLRQEMIDVLTSAYDQTNRALRVSQVPVGSNSASEASECNVQPLAHQAAAKFKQTTQLVLAQMEPLVQTGAAHFAELQFLFSDVVQSQFYQFLGWFNTVVSTYTKPRRAFESPESNMALPFLEPTPPFALFLAFVCRELAADGIAECVRGLIECLPGSAFLSSSAAGDASISRGKKMGQVDVAHMIEVSRETAAELFQWVARFYGDQLCTLVEKGVRATAWSEMDEEPHSIQEMAVAVVETAMRAGKEVALALGDPQYQSRTSSRSSNDSFRRRSGGALRSRGAGASGMSLDVERIFGRNVVIYSQPPNDVTAQWFVASMLRMAVKALGEWLRLEELTSFGLQQVQLNAEFLRSAALVHLGVDSTQQEEIESLLSELLSTARERATEDVLMEQSSVVAIVSTRSAQILSRRG